MSEHTYKVGQTVTIVARHQMPGAAGTYTILALMPEERGDHQYRVRSTTSPQLRVVRESEIARATTPEPDIFRASAH